MSNKSIEEVLKETIEIQHQAEQTIKQLQEALFNSEVERRTLRHFVTHTRLETLDDILQNGWKFAQEKALKNKYIRTAYRVCATYKKTLEEIKNA